MKNKFLLTAGLSLGLAFSANAQTNHYWTGTTDTRYALPANWLNDDLPPGISTTAILNFNASDISNNLALAGGDRTVRGLNFSGDFTSNPFTILTEDLTGTIARALRIDAGGDGTFVNVASGTQGDITIGTLGNFGWLDNVTVTNNGSGLLDFASVVESSGSPGNAVTFTGTGTTLLSKTNNTFIANGPINLNGGTVQFYTSGSFGDAANSLAFNGGRIQMLQDGPVILNRSIAVNAGGATIDIATNRVLQLGGALSGSGTLTVTGSGGSNARVELQNANNVNTFTGNTIIDGGLIEFSNRDALGAYNRIIILDNGGHLSALTGGIRRLHKNTTIVLGSAGGILSAQGTSRLTVDSNISGSGSLTIGYNKPVTLQGHNTYSGNTIIESAASLTLANVGFMVFFIGTNGVNNGITGAGRVTLDGEFIFDLSGASTTIGDSWTIVDHSSLTESYGSNFSVNGFTNNGGVWTSGNYQFSQSSGVLTVIPEPSTWLLMALGGAFLVILRRRRVA